MLRKKSLPILFITMYEDFVKKRNPHRSLLRKIPEVVPLMFKDERLTAQEPGDGSLTVSRGLMLHCRNIHVSIPEQTSLSLICNVIKALQDLC